MNDHLQIWIMQCECKVEGVVIFCLKYEVTNVECLLSYIFFILLKSIRKDGYFILYVQYVCCSENQKSFLCPTISSTQQIYLPPTPTQPYTHECPTATGFLSAYMYTWNLGI